MTTLTQADLFRPGVRNKAVFYDATLILGATIFIALAARLAIYLPFSPVPISGQTLAVLLVGALLGSKRGSIAILAYLAEGISGLPVFAGGLTGPAVLAGPTGGYLLGFVFAAFIVGWLAEKGWDKKVLSTIGAMVIGNLAIYSVGLLWLAQFVGVDTVFAAGLYPFLIGDALKVLMAALLLPISWKWLSGLK